MAILKDSSTVVERRERFGVNFQNEDQTPSSEADDIDDDAESLLPLASRFGLPRPLLGLYSNRKPSSAATIANLQTRSNDKEQPSAGISPHSLQDTNNDIMTPNPAIRSPRLFGPLQSLAMTSKRFRQLAAPTLFKSITIGPYVNWKDALARLDTIFNCEAVKVYTKSFLMDNFTESTFEENWRGDSNYQGPKPPKQMADVLLQTLSKMTNLEKLTLFIPGQHTKVFQRSFETSTVNFPSIRTLVLGPHLDRIVAQCPNVEVISTCNYRWLQWNVEGEDRDQHSTDLVRAAGQAKHLRHFELHDEWSNARLKDVHQKMPLIHVLAMPSSPQHYDIKSILPSLGQFQNLTTLILSLAQYLNVGFSGPWCADAHMGPGEQRTRDPFQRQGEEANARVANMVFAAVLTLKTLWIGDVARATVTRTPFGNEITWAYVPRLKPYRDDWQPWDH
ncbi:MAG: hypothetical protein Q9183_002927 [Haloplaca sp. 2 TL-2023]